MYSRTISRTTFLMTLSFLAVLAMGLVLLSGYSQALAGNSIIYVDAGASAGGDGRTWGTAYRYLQDALDEANANGASDHEIWVAEGIYYPDQDDDGDHISDAVTETFRLNYNNVQLYGGFAGSETTRNQRNWPANVTVLSGDIDGNDTTNSDGVVTEAGNISGNNAHHVLYLDGVTNEPITGTTTIDGFAITAGHASAAGSWVDTDDGGGLYCKGIGDGSECSPMLMNLTFSGNAAVYDGGAIYNLGQHGKSHPTLMHITFSGNSAGKGGAMYNNSYFSGYSSPKLTDVTFSGNSAGFGGAMYNYGQQGWSSPELENVTFIGNSASGSANGSDGGAMYNDGEDGLSSPTLTNVSFIDNSAEDDGGAIYNNATNSGSSNLKLTNVTFRNNTAGWGGAMASSAYTGISNSVLVNVVFSGNSASDSGGAMYNLGDRGACNPTFINVTFSDNSAVNRGGAMVNAGYLDPTHGHPSFYNVILWGNTAETGDQIYNSFADIRIKNSNVEGGWDGSGIYNNNSPVYDDGGNIDEDPQFVEAASGDVHLKSTSPAIDAGDNSAVPLDVTTDLDDSPRFVDFPPDGGTGNGTSPFVDMGAYEMQTDVLIYLPLLLK